MKKLFFLFTILCVSALFGKMHIDIDTNRFSTVPSSKNIDQDEYHDLAAEIKEMLPCGFLNAKDQDLFFIHSMLTESIATPTAIRLWSDIEQLLKDYKKFASQMKRYKPDRD